MEIPKRLSYVEFKKIYSRVPRLSVELVILIPGGVLLTLRSIEPYMGEWHVSVRLYWLKCDALVTQGVYFGYIY